MSQPRTGSSIRSRISSRRRDGSGRGTLCGMCRSIKTLRILDEPAPDDEIRAAALQYVRKVSGCARPSQANGPTFDRAVAEVAGATRALLDALVTAGPPKTREEQAAKGRERWQRRAERMQAKSGPARET